MTAKKLILNPVGMLILGVVSGVMSRVFDMHTQILCEVFSQLQVWVLIGVLITLSGPTRLAAVINILPFCLGMIGGYYFVAVITHGVYAKRYIIGWTVFALLSPVFAFFTWRAGKRDLPGKLLGAAIVVVSALSSVIMFEGFRFYDFIIDALLVYVLFFMKIRKNTGKDGFRPQK